MKYLSARTLADAVRQHYAHALANTLDYELIVTHEEASIMEFRHKQLDFHRSMKWVMLDWGWVIETSQESGNGKDIIKETLISHDGKAAVITARKVESVTSGEDYPVWKCLREDDYPVGSIVRLVRAKTPSLWGLSDLAPF
jgi:hypothetical protein